MVDAFGRVDRQYLFALFRQPFYSACCAHGTPIRPSSAPAGTQPKLDHSESATVKATSQKVLPSDSANHATVQSARRAFWLGFFTNATNPKATIFFLAVFTTVVSAQTP